MKKIYLASDHRGFSLKEEIKQWLTKQGYQIEDVGNHEKDSQDDYPDFAHKLARSLDKGERGILFCGSGIGMAIAANRHTGVRCALGFNSSQIKHGRANDKINCLSLPADYVDFEKASQMVKIFLETDFIDKENYRRRVEKIEKEL